MSVKKLVKPDNVKKGKEEWYTTTFSIPIWMADLLKEEANRAGYRGMNMVVVIACTNHLLGAKSRKSHNDKLLSLAEKGVITPEDKDDLWL